MMAIAGLDRRLREQKLDARLVGSIHDELVIEGREADAEPVKALLKDTMEKAFVAIFPQATLRNLVEVKAGPTWAAAQEKPKKPEEHS